MDLGYVLSVPGSFLEQFNYTPISKNQHELFYFDNLLYLSVSISLIPPLYHLPYTFWGYFLLQTFWCRILEYWFNAFYFIHKYTFAIHLLLITSVATLHTFWYVVFSLSFSSKLFLLLFLFYPLWEQVLPIHNLLFQKNHVSPWLPPSDSMQVYGMLIPWSCPKLCLPYLWKHLIKQADSSEQGFVPWVSVHIRLIPSSKACVFVPSPQMSSPLPVHNSRVQPLPPCCSWNSCR